MEKKYSEEPENNYYSAAVKISKPRLVSRAEFWSQSQSREFGLSLDGLVSFNITAFQNLGVLASWVPKFVFPCSARPYTLQNPALDVTRFLACHRCRACLHVYLFCRTYTVWCVLTDQRSAHSTCCVDILIHDLLFLRISTIESGVS